MRVLLDCRMASWTGVGRYTTGLVRALAEISDLELVCVVAPGEAPPAPGLESVTATANPLLPAGMLELGRIVRRVSPDLTHCLHFPTPMPVGAPLVSTLHDLSPLLVDGLMASRLRRGVYRWSNARVANLARVIICPSAHTAADVARVFPAARGKAVVVPEAADDFASGDVADLAGGLAELTSAPYIFSMGSTRPHKDLPTLLKAFVLVAPHRPDLRLLLAGAEQPGYIAATLADAPEGLRERIAFTGHVTDEELRALYRGAEAFAFPSRYEGFGLPPLEAMAMGTPVVAADAASLPEVVGDAALTFPAGDGRALADALESVLSDSAVATRLRDAGRARAGELTWAAAARNTREVYAHAFR